MGISKVSGGNQLVKKLFPPLIRVNGKIFKITRASSKLSLAAREKIVSRARGRKAVIKHVTIYLVYEN